MKLRLTRFLLGLAVASAAWSQKDGDTVTVTYSGSTELATASTYAEGCKSNSGPLTVQSSPTGGSLDFNYDCQTDANHPEAVRTVKGTLSVTVPTTPFTGVFKSGANYGVLYPSSPIAMKADVASSISGSGPQSLKLRIDRLSPKWDDPSDCRFEGTTTVSSVSCDVLGLSGHHLYEDASWDFNADTFLTVGIGMKTDGYPVSTIVIALNPIFTQPGQHKLSIDHIEVVQVVQNATNDAVPLVARKGTVVRVFPKVETGFLEGVTGTLRGIQTLAGTNQAVELRSYSPLRPFNAPMTAKSDPDRESEWDSLDFLLPTGWTAEGDLQFIVRLEEPGGAFVESGPRDLVHFRPAPGWPYPFGIGFIPVCYQAPGQDYPLCPSTGVRFRTDFLDKLYPVAEDGIAYYKLPVPEWIWTKPVPDAKEDPMSYHYIQDLLTAGQRFYAQFDPTQVAVFGGLEQLALWFPRITAMGFVGYSAPVWLHGQGRVVFLQDTSGEEPLDASHKIAHEVGHNLGLRHPGPRRNADGSIMRSATGGAVPLDYTCKAVDAGSAWPYADGLIHEVGYDPEKKRFVPANKFDLMTYCSWPGDNIWLSTFSYNQLFSNGFAGPFHPLAVAPKATPRDSNGTVSDILTITGTAQRDNSTGMIQPAILSKGTPDASDPAGTHCVRLAGDSGTLAETCFTLTFTNPEIDGPLPLQNFFVRMPAVAGVRRIVLLAGSQEVASLSAGPAPPVIQITSPQPGDRWTGTPAALEWIGSDPDGDSLSYAVSYSADGTNFLPLAIDVTANRYALDAAKILGGKSVYFRVVATDGIHSTMATAGPIEVVQTPTLEVDQQQIQFLKVGLGQTAEVTLTVKNSGTGPLRLSSMTSDSELFTVISPTRPPTIPAGESQEIIVRFRPDAAGSQNATLTLASPDVPSVTVGLSGSGVDALVPSMEVTPGSLGFGTVAVGQSADQSIKIKNYGPGTLTVSSIKSSNTAFNVIGVTTPLPVKAGAEQVVVVRFTPSVDGGQSGTLTVAGNDPDHRTVTIAMSGTGFASGPLISVSPSSLDFGSVVVGQFKELPVIVKNGGRAGLSVTAAITDATGSSGFSLASPASFSVAAGDQQTVTVRFTPDASASRSGQLTITSNDTTQKTITVGLAGMGTAPAASAILRTLVYHEITSFAKQTIPTVGGRPPVLSANGNRIAFGGLVTADNMNHVYVINPDGSGMREVDHYQPKCFCDTWVDISADGSRVASSEGLQLRVANADGSGAKLLVTDREVNEFRITAAGDRIYFTVRRGEASAKDPTTERGLYVINADGTGLKQLAGPKAIGTLVGAAPDFPIGSTGPTLDISADGSHIVFGTTVGSQGERLFAVNGDGSGLRSLLGPYDFLRHAAISAGGSKVAYDVIPPPCCSSPNEVGVINWDGSGKTVLVKGAINAGDERIGDRYQLTPDGSRLSVGGWGRLYKTDGSGIYQLSIRGQMDGGIAWDSLASVTMNSQANRFAFLTRDDAGFWQLGTLDFDPGTLGNAPQITEPTLSQS